MGGKCCECIRKNEAIEEENEIQKDPLFATKDDLNDLRRLKNQEGLFDDADALLGKDKLKTLKSLYGQTFKEEIKGEEEAIEKVEKAELRKIPEKQKHDPPYWNEKTMDNIEDEIYEISEEKSENIFKFFNNIRLNPKSFINQSNDENISNLLEKADKFPYKPNTLIKNNGYFYQLREGLLNMYSTPKGEDNLIEEIENLCFKDFDIRKRYMVECPIEKEEEAVWNLLKKYEDVALEELLTNQVNYCVICALPIEDSYNLKVFFLMLSQ